MAGRSPCYPTCPVAKVEVALPPPREGDDGNIREACWRLSKACGQWAVESRDSAAREAFRQMATAWGRLAFNEEFTSPLDERIDPPPSSESSEPTPAEILTSSLLTPSSENAQPEVKRVWTSPRERLSLRRSVFPKLWGKSPSH